MADMTTIKGRIQETIYPNGTGAITAESHQALLLEMVDDINAKKADKEEVAAVAESVSMLSQEVESNYNNFTESLDALEQKVDNLPQGGGDFNAEGNYPLLHVGTADDLAGRGESVPASFGFRASGGKSIKDGRAYIKRIKGNSVVWNQKVKRLNYVSNGVSSNCEGNVITLNGVCTTTWAPITQGINVIQGHKYLIVGHVLTNPNGLSFNISLFNNVPGAAKYDANTNFNWSIGICSGSRVSGFGVDGFPSETDLTGIQFRTIVTDLTQMFQAGNEPTTIEDFNARVATLGVDLNAYNEGQVIHCNTECIKSVGDNAWDEEWEVINGSYISSKNYIRVIPNATYYTNMALSNGIRYYDKDYNRVGSTAYAGTGQTFIVPANVQYMKFSVASSYGTTYKNDIMIALVHSGWKKDTDAGYQPYWQDTLPLPIINKYFPQGMKSAGTAHDEIRYNKATQKWEKVQRVGSVDMGSLNWSQYGVVGTFYTYSIKDYKKPTNNAERSDGLLCQHYVGSTDFKAVSIDDKAWLKFESENTIVFRDSAYTDAASFKAAMQGVILYYELAEPIVTELDAEDQNFRDYYQVADFGTEMSQSSVPSAAFSADIIYQFNAVDMIREHELEITELQNIIATMQAQLTSLINGGQ